MGPLFLCSTRVFWRGCCLCEELLKRVVEAKTARCGAPHNIRLDININYIAVTQSPFQAVEHLWGSTSKGGREGYGQIRSR